MKPRHLAAAFAVLALSAGACGQPAGKGEEPPVGYESRERPEETHRDVALIPINHLVNRSPAGVVATVVSIGETKWNSPDHKDFKDERGVGVRAYRHRIVTLRVERVLWSDDPRVSLGREVEAFTPGDGTATGYQVPGGLRENNASGPLEVGAEMIVLLGTAHVTFKEGDSSVERRLLGFGFRSGWTLRNGIAVSALKERTVPAQALIDRLLVERRRGYVPTDHRGDIDPLQEEESSPLPEPTPPLCHDFGTGRCNNDGRSDHDDGNR